MTQTTLPLLSPTGKTDVATSVTIEKQDGAGEYINILVEITPLLKFTMVAQPFFHACFSQSSNQFLYTLAMTKRAKMT